MKRKVYFWLFILLGVAFGTTSYFLNDRQEVKSLCDYTVSSGQAVTTKYQNTSLSIEPSDGNQILVNNKNKLAQIMEPTDKKLLSVYENKNTCYKVRDTTVRLTKECLDALNQMMQDFQTATGKHDVIVLSGYRSAEQQQELMDQETARSGAVKAASIVAQIGGSEHHTGLAMDLGIYTDSGKSKKFRSTGDYAWLIKNMYQYGFVVRYQSNKSNLTEITNEPWHIRYMGVPHAGAMEQLGFCLEEYIDYLHGYTASGQHLFVSSDDIKYEIYTVSASEANDGLPLPEGKSYSVSGDNLGNYIVTIEL